MRGLLRRFIQLLLPARCAGCQRTGPDAICQECAAGLEHVRPHYCRHCGRRRRTGYDSPDCAECHGRDIGIELGRSALVYNETGRGLLADFKFNGNMAAGQELFELAASGLPSSATELYGLEVSPRAVLPVPLHRSRLRERGFNQSELLARLLADHLSLPLDTGLLLRSRDTGTQVGLTEAARRSNVQGAFDVPQGRRGSLSSATYIVVDDLMTTGATLASCARALRRRGAAGALGFSLFSTVPPSALSSPDDESLHDVPPPLL